MRLVIESAHLHISLTTVLGRLSNALCIAFVVTDLVGIVKLRLLATEALPFNSSDPIPHARTFPSTHVVNSMPPYLYPLAPQKSAQYCGVIATVDTLALAKIETEESL